MWHKRSGVKKARAAAEFAGPRAAWRAALEAVSLALAIALFYHPIAFSAALSTGGDLLNLFLPALAWSAETVRGEGVWPLWNPYNFAGHPFAAAAQSAVFYPPARLFPFAAAPARAANAYLALHLIAAGLGLWAFARARGGLRLRRGAGPWLAGFLFPCCAWFWGHTEHLAHVAAIAWIPWLLWAAGEWARGRAAAGAAVAMITALQLLAGHPQMAFTGWLAAGPWALWRAAAGARGAREILRRLGGAAARLAAAGALAAALAALQILPTAELSARSYRRFDSPEWAARYSMPPALLAQLLHPHLFGSYARGWARPLAYNEYGIYIGLPALLLAGAAFARGARRRRQALFWAALALAGIALGLGGNADPRRLFDFAAFQEFPPPGASPLGALTALFPPAWHFRVPGRYLLLFALGAAALAALGARALELRLARRRAATPAREWLRRAFAPAAAALIFLALYPFSRAERGAFRADARPALEFLRATPPPFTGDPLENRLYRLTVADDDLYARDGSAPEAAGDGLTLDERARLRAARLTPNLNLLARRALLSGYEEGLLPTVRHKDFLFAFNASLRRADPDALLLALGGVRWLWSDLPITSPDWAHEARGFGAEDDAPGALYRNRLWRGVVFEAREFPGVDWAALDGPWERGGALALERARDLRSYDLTSAPAGWRDRLQRDHAAPRWRVRSLSPNELLIEPAPGAAPPAAAASLILAMTPYPGWRALDAASGAPARLEPLNAWNWRLEWPTGARALRVAYEPASFRVGAFISAAALAFWTAWLGWLLAARAQRQD